MLGFGKKKQNDEGFSREYVRRVFADGYDASLAIAQAVQMSTQGEVVFPVNDDVSIEISLAILGTSLGVLKGHSQVMPAERGHQVERLCKRSIQNDYGLSADFAAKMNEVLDDYAHAFEKCMADNNNPFAEVSGMMLGRCLGPQSIALCLPGTSNINPFTHQVVGDVMMMTVTQALAFWKDK